MSSLDHAHVVRAIADSQQDRLVVLLDKFDDEGFLQRGYTACARVRNLKNKCGSGDLQHMTALHIRASSKNDIEISFSSAYVKLLLSKRGIIVSQKKLENAEDIVPLNNARSSSSPVPVFRSFLMELNRFVVTSLPA